MNIYSFIKISLSTVLILGSINMTKVHAENKTKQAPEANAEEAKIIHWQMPDIDRDFWDISNLTENYISTTPTDRKDGLSVGSLSSYSNEEGMLTELAKEITEGKHGDIDSLLVAHKDKLLFESYYRKGRVDLPHPQSSASKVYTGLALGRAIQLGYLTMADLNKPLISFLKELDRSKLAEGSERITLHHALTMRSGIRITEEQWKNSSKSPEMLKGQGLVQTYLEYSAPITDESQVFKYQNDPMLVMQVIEAVVPGSAKDFIKKELLAKMGIISYGWETDKNSGLPGSASITSRDMIKFGKLALNKGKWKGKQLVPAEFIAKAISRNVITGDDDIFGGGKDVSNQAYGYYWWSSDLKYKDKNYFSVSAQGGGGIYLIVVEELELIVVVTAHHTEDATQQITAERILPAFVDSRSEQHLALSGPYLGQTPPKLVPEVFAPDIISTNGWETSGMFSPDMKEFYYIREVENEGALQQQFVVFKEREGRWQSSVISPRVGQPFISPDGNTMHLGKRFKTRVANGWSEIKQLGTEFNDFRIMRLTSSASGTWVFDEATRDGKGILRYSKLVDGKRGAPKALAKNINTGQWNAHPFIAPDESYIIWDGQRNSSVRNADLFISFKQKDGSWGEAIRMGDEINTASSEAGARVTPDGKYLFFNRKVGEFEYTHADGKVETIPNVDVFWVDAKILETYRKG